MNLKAAIHSRPTNSAVQNLTDCRAGVVGRVVLRSGMDEKLLNLPWEIQLALGSGYVAYLSSSVIGFDAR